MTAVIGLVLLAKLLSGSIVLTSDNTVLEDLLANEGGHGLLVVLKTWSRVVGRAGAVVG